MPGARSRRGRRRCRRASARAAPPSAEAGAVPVDREEVVAGLVGEGAAARRGRRRADHRDRPRGPMRQASEPTWLCPWITSRRRTRRASPRTARVGEVAARAPRRRGADGGSSRCGSSAVAARGPRARLGFPELLRPRRPVATKGRVGIAEERPTSATGPRRRRYGKRHIAPSSPRVKGASCGEQPLERARDVGVVIAGDEAHVLGRAEAVHEDPRGLPFARQPDVAEVARAGDVIRGLRADVGDEAPRGAPCRAMCWRLRRQLIQPVRRLLRSSRSCGRGSGPTCGSVRWARRNMRGNAGRAARFEPPPRRQALPMKMPASSTSTPPTMTWNVGAQERRVHVARADPGDRDELDRDHGGGDRRSRAVKAFGQVSGTR